ncbi:sialidase family protein [Cerasicoccus maritimus]|uniref:sialidase family protein n=1 Tax=Cerasicoccus maritimus TaxID=490089 RepID=UPI0028528D36|nr:sialidase family protein [Cerasicoccus maritimus]
MLPLTNQNIAIQLEPDIRIGRLKFSTNSLPSELQLDAELGVVTARNAQAKRIYLGEYACHPRSILSQNGDILLMHAAGGMHYAWRGSNQAKNKMLLHVSKDQGLSWSDPVLPWQCPYSLHAPIPFISQRTGEFYVFGTEPMIGHYQGEENAPIGFRRFNDQSKEWDDVRLIRPLNCPDFQGMSAMRMCETPSGTWLLGTHRAKWSRNQEGDESVITEQFLLRSEDQGESWTLLPDTKGWQCPGHSRMDEARPIVLSDGQILLIARTPEGHLWQSRSIDDGMSWTEFQSTPLKHLDAPPMVFTLDGGSTLIAFIHNKDKPDVIDNLIFSQEIRSELWFSLSTDGSRTWSEPRFLAVNACTPEKLTGWGSATPMLSYADLICIGDTLHLFVDHQMRQVIQISFLRSELGSFPTLKELQHPIS